MSITESEPQHDHFAEWDHIVEASINIPSGKIVIAGPTEYLPDAFRLSVEAGIYRVRISYANLESVSQDGLEGEDQYRIVLWPTEYKPPTILKQRSAFSFRLEMPS